MPRRLKICCIQSLEEARLAIRHGASLVGLVAAMPSGPGPIPEDRIAAIAAAIPPGVTSVLLTCATGAAEIIEQHRRCRTSAIQLVDALPEGTHQELRAALPGIGLVQVVHVVGPESIDEARRLEPLVDALLLDSGDPGAAIKELGGTGRVHDWEVSRRIVAARSKPVFLAGGLRPENIAEAVRRVQPFGIDVCTGVRTDAAMDGAKVRALASALASA